VSIPSWGKNIFLENLVGHFIDKLYIWSSFRSHRSIVQVLPEREQRCEACMAFKRSRSLPLISGRQRLGLWLQEFPNARFLTVAKQLV